MAEDALTNVLESMDNRKINLPKASALQGENIFYIEPKLNVAFAIMLKNERKKWDFRKKRLQNDLV